MNYKVCRGHPLYNTKKTLNIRIWGHPSRRTLFRVYLMPLLPSLWGACGALGGGTGTCRALRGGVAFRALWGGGACEAVGGGGACRARVGAFGHYAANEEGAWGSRDVVSMPSRKTYRTRRNVLINIFLNISSIPPSIRDWIICNARSLHWNKTYQKV